MFAGMNSPMPRAVRLLLFTALVALLVHVAHTVFGLGGAASHTFVDDWLYTLVLAACALMCFARGAGPRGERAAWILIGTGIAAWTAGDAYWAFHLSHQEEIAYPSLADAARLMLFPAAYAGIALLVRARVPRFHASLWLDGAIGALAIAAVGAAVMYRAIEPTTQGDVEAVAANVAYPLGDLLLVGFVIGAVALTGWRPGRGLVLIALGLSVNAIANGIYLYRDATGGALEHSPVDSLWLLSALLLALAAWIPATRSRALRLEGRRLLAIPSFFAAVAVGLQVYNQFAPVNRFAAGFATATLGVVIVRMALLFSDHLTLLAVSRRESQSDPVTGLGNRRRMMLDLEETIEGGRPHAFALFDLDGFKAYNDSFGHPAGDALLSRLGENLAAAVQPTGSAYRLGGDEFCVLAPLDGRERGQRRGDRLSGAVGGRQGVLDLQLERLGAAPRGGRRRLDGAAARGPPHVRAEAASLPLGRAPDPQRAAADPARAGAGPERASAQRREPRRAARASRGAGGRGAGRRGAGRRAA